MRHTALRLRDLGKKWAQSLGCRSSLFIRDFSWHRLWSAGALKGAIFAANIYEQSWISGCSKRHGEPSRHHSGQLTLNTPEGLIAFCERDPGGSAGGQLCDTGTVGYAGIRQRSNYGGRCVCTGIIDRTCSADGPLKPPYAVYFQGGLTWYHAKLGILMSLQKLYEQNLVNKDLLC